VDIVHSGAEHESEECSTLTLVHSASNAEIEERNFSVRKHKEVSAMKIAMEDALDDGSLHESDHSGSNDLVGIDTSVADGIDIIEVETGKSFHHKNSSGDERRVRSRNDVPTLSESNKRCCDIEHVLRFEAEIEFLTDRFGEKFDKGGWICERSKGKSPDKERCEPCHDTDVFVDKCGNRRALYFHDDGFSSYENRSVHLRD
jgi:hypothetical protein